MRSLAMVVIPMLVVAMADAQYGGGSCDWSQCRYDRYLAQSCCSSSGTCCDFANNGNGRFPGNNGGQGYNPGYNNGNGYNPGFGNGYNPGYGNGYNPGYGNNNGGSCIRDSECSADLKCSYLRSGYQCTRPNYYG